MKKLTLFLIRKKLGVKKWETFRFDNQKSDDVYFFDNVCLMKRTHGRFIKSGVSLNWLLDDDCHITKVRKEN